MGGGAQQHHAQPYGAHTAQPLLHAGAQTPHSLCCKQGPVACRSLLHAGAQIPPPPLLLPLSCPVPLLLPWAAHTQQLRLSPVCSSHTRQQRLSPVCSCYMRQQRLGSMYSPQTAAPKSAPPLRHSYPSSAGPLPPLPLHSQAPPPHLLPRLRARGREAAGVQRGPAPPHHPLLCWRWILMARCTATTARRPRVPTHTPASRAPGDGRQPGRLRLWMLRVLLLLVLQQLRAGCGQDGVHAPQRRHRVEHLGVHGGQPQRDRLTGHGVAVLRAHRHACVCVCVHACVCMRTCVHVGACTCSCRGACTSA